MTPEQAVTVVAVLQSAWPYVEVSEATMTVWFDTLADAAYEDGMDVARRLVRSDERFPSVARFRQTWSALVRHRRMSAPLGLPSPDRATDRPLAMERLAELRRVLEQVGKDDAA